MSEPIQPSSSDRLHRPASQVLQGVIDTHNHDLISFGEIMNALHERGFGLLMMVFVLPNCVPIPIPPGMSTVFSLPLLFLATQMLMGKSRPWLPGWLEKRAIRRSTLAAIIEAIAPRLRMIEKVLRPRLCFASTPAGEKVVGVFWLIYAISIAVPLPMTNFLPGVGILIMSLGLLGRDGLILLSGIGIGMFGVGVTVVVLLAGKAAVMSLFGLG